MNIGKYTAPFFLTKAGFGDFVSLLAEAEKNQWRSPAEIKQIQSEKLTKLVEHAATKVPYYKQLFEKQGLSARDILSADDLSKLPILTKQTLREKLAEILTPGIKLEELTKCATSGSTGVPIEVYFDKHRSNCSWVYNTRANRWGGLTWGARVANCWTKQLREPSPPERPHYKQLLDHFHQMLLGENPESYFSPFGYSKDDLSRYALELKDFKPEVLYGFPSTVVEITKSIEKKGVTGIKPKTVLCGGEVFYKDMREYLEGFFGARCHSRYGTREADVLACDCEHGNMHCNDDFLVVELIKSPDAEYHSVLVTDLNNFAVPLIRYDLGDAASVVDSQCPCGRGLSLIGAVEGRKSDILRTFDGKMILSSWVKYLFYETHSIDKYQVRQIDYQNFSIDIVPNSPDYEQELYPIKNKICEMFGEGTKININEVADLPPQKGGKYAYIISEIPTK